MLSGPRPGGRPLIYVIKVPHEDNSKKRPEAATAQGQAGHESNRAAARSTQPFGIILFLIFIWGWTGGRRAWTRT